MHCDQPFGTATGMAEQGPKLNARVCAKGTGLLKGSHDEVCVCGGGGVGV